jgi:hypothetical protein
MTWRLGVLAVQIWAARGCEADSVIENTDTNRRQRRERRKEGRSSRWAGREKRWIKGRGVLALVLNLNLNPDLNLGDLNALEIKRKIKITIKKLAKHRHQQEATERTEKSAKEFTRGGKSGGS